MQCENQYLQIDTIKSILKHIIPWNDDFVKKKEKGRDLNKKDIFLCGHCGRWVSEAIQNNVTCEQKKCNKVQKVCDMWKVGLVKESQHVGYV